MSVIDLTRQGLKERTFLDIAYALSRLSTCHRRHVGCVLVDVHGRIVGSGFNGVPRGMPHCNTAGFKCPGADAEPGTNLDMCYAIHAEQNALAMCERPFELQACYSTSSPCITCVKLLMNTSCKDIYFRVEYPHVTAKELWLAGNNRRWLQG